MDASNAYLFRTLKTLAKVKVKDKIATRGRQLKINPPTRWWEWYYRWRETRERNIVDLEHILSLVFEKLLFLRSQPRTREREKVVRKFVRELKNACKGLVNLKHTYNHSADTVSGIEDFLEAIEDCCIETTEWLKSGFGKMEEKKEGVSLTGEAEATREAAGIPEGEGEGRETMLHKEVGSETSKETVHIVEPVESDYSEFETDSSGEEGEREGGDGR